MCCGGQNVHLLICKERIKLGFSDKDVHLVAVLDRSGSMSRLIDEMRQGFNSLVAEQRKQDGETYLTVTVFDNSIDRLFTGVNARFAGELTSSQYYARGNTALLDAIGRTITEVKSLRNVPKKTIFVIATDGLENASIEYTKGQIQTLIRQAEGKRKYPWSFIFMGAGVDSFNQSNYGYTRSARTVSVTPDYAGTQAFYGAVGDTVAMARTNTGQTVNSLNISGYSNANYGSNPIDLNSGAKLDPADVKPTKKTNNVSRSRTKKEASNVTGGSIKPLVTSSS